MNEWIGRDDEPTLTDVQREFSSWECGRGTSSLHYARRPAGSGRPAVLVRGEDPRDLRDQILRVIGKETDGVD